MGKATSFESVKGALVNLCILATIFGLQLALLELGSFAILRMNMYRRGATLNELEYRSYVLWRRAPHQAVPAGPRNETALVGADGLRRTVHSICDGKTYTIWMFGGSTMWGTGSPDWGTIPSLLAERYQKAGRPVCVRNYGESAWVSTQEVIQLLLELKQQAKKPDLVIFYDGANDPYIPYRSGRFDVHQNFDRIKGQFEGDAVVKWGSFGWVLRTNTYELVKRLATRFGLLNPDRGAYRKRAKDLEWMISKNVEYYLNNVDLVDALSKKYGFQYAFFWQPIIFVENKRLTTKEAEIRRLESDMSPGLEEIYKRTYGLVRAIGKGKIQYIADVFNNETQDIYIDSVHVSSEGNRIIAARIFDILPQRGL